jgi:hypothetical protein
MPRDDSIAENAKQRSLRVPLDHFEKGDWIVRSKVALTVLAAALAAVYVAWLFVGGRVGQRQTSPGPLAAVHSGWDNNCVVCHQNFKPLRADAVQLTSLGASPEKIRESLDAACIKCHNEPEHHHAAKHDEVQRCSACHYDHLGRTANIVRSGDHACVVCHRNIKEHIDASRQLAGNRVGDWKNVTGFGPVPEGSELPHPKFRSLQQGDPGNLKFNHWLHMQPGAAAANAKPESQKKLAQLAEKFRPQYEKYAKDGSLIQLDCDACHEPDSSGQYMRPIAYEQHCQACHPLRLEVAESQPAAEVPHGLDAVRLEAAVDGLLVAGLKKQATPPAADASSKPPIIPGRTLGNNLAQQINQDRRASAAKLITVQCQECHETKADSEPLAGMPQVVPPNIPTQWFAYARFDHNSHRHVSEGCKACHAAAFFGKDAKPQFLKPSGDAALARDSEIVMIAQQDKCAECHAPNPTDLSRARYDCAECHNYHDRDKVIGVKPTTTTLPLPKSNVSARNTHRGEAAVAAKGHLPFQVRLASFAGQATGDPGASKPVAGEAGFVGAGTCGSVGCHGDSQPDAPTWRTSLMKFFSNDPHAQAYDVLWTDRGREMTRLLAEPRTKDQLSDARHLQEIQRLCIGCHATPPGHTVANANSYSLGVQCESCHGRAGAWLHAHYLSSFQSESARKAAAGFNDTKSLDSRAATCMKCHVGPNDEAGMTQVVDHDLIAAGHPRLAFEFHAYFQSLPAHWNRPADEEKHNKTPDQQNAFHFRSWLAGQAEVAEHRKKLLERDKKLFGDANINDFSNLDCFACHHQLLNAAWRQRSNFTDMKPFVWPSRELPLLSDKPTPSDRLGLARELVEDTIVDRLRSAGPTATVSEKHELVEKNIENRRWDAALQAYLAIRAITRDIQIKDDPAQAAEMKTLDAELNALAKYLADTSFNSRQREDRRPTPYDSPRAHTFEALVQHTKPVLEVLKRLEKPN